MNLSDQKWAAQASRDAGERPVLARGRLAASRRLADPTGRRASYVDAQVSGVPYFVFNGGYTLSGVYSPAAIAGTMALAVAS